MTDNSHDPDCSEVLSRVWFFLDHELDEASLTDIRRHLEECGPCLQKYDLERTVKSLVARSCQERAPEALRQKVLYQIRQVHIEIAGTE